MLIAALLIQLLASLDRCPTVLCNSCAWLSHASDMLGISDTAVRLVVR